MGGWEKLGELNEFIKNYQIIEEIQEETSQSIPHLGNRVSQEH